MQNFGKQCAPNFISCEFAAIQTLLVQGSLEIPIKVTVQWEDEQAMEILRRQKKLAITSEKWISMKTNWTQLKNLMNQEVKHFKKPTQVWWLSTHEAVEAIYSAWTLLILSLGHEAASRNKDGAAKARGMI